MNQGPEKITKSLAQSLIEVNNGDYEAFRRYLIQEQMTYLNLSDGLGATVDLTQLIQALKGTQISDLFLLSNKINDEGAQTIGTALKGSHIRGLSLSCNQISSLGAEKLIVALRETQLSKLFLSGNHLGKNVSEKLAALIPSTKLLHLNIGFKDETLENALKANRQKLILTPYYLACLTLLEQTEKEKYFQDKHYLNEECEIDSHKFASGILMNMNKVRDVQNHILSYFPLINCHIANRFKELALDTHKNGIKRSSVRPG